MASYTSAQSAKWRSVAEDLDIAQVGVPGGGFFSSEVLAFRSSLTRFSMAVIKASELGLQRTTVKALADSAGATVALNANYFDEYGRALGLVLSRGLVLQPLHKRGNTLTGVLGVTSQGIVRIMGRSDFSAEGLAVAIQAGPRLVTNGRPTTGLAARDEVSRRSGVCVDRDSRIILFITSSRLGGVSLSQLQGPLIDTLGCMEAINLDGGGSSQLYFRGTGLQREAVSLEGQDLIPIAIGLVPTGEGSER